MRFERTSAVVGLERPSPFCSAVSNPHLSTKATMRTNSQTRYDKLYFPESRLFLMES
jgi:hypothetical protein